MAKIDLTQYGITGTTELVYNPSFEQLNWKVLTRDSSQNSMLLM